MKVEICVDSLASVAACAEAGADRIELCAGLVEGGTTPSLGFLRQARTRFAGEIAMMIRPRGGDFLYDDAELAAMADDIRAARDHGADAVVFGCLDVEGLIDPRACERLLAACDGLPAVFHRAFDVSRDPEASLETLAGLGFTRVLTSGGEPDVIRGLSRIAALVAQAGDRITILAGGGVTPANAAELVARTGVREIHLSARSAGESPMRHRRPDIPMGAAAVPGEYERKTADPAIIRAARAAVAF